MQAYLSQMSSLLLEKDLRESEEDSEVRTLAQARTLTMLSRADQSRKADAMQFLVEAELVQRVEGTGPIIKLSGADLLSGARRINSGMLERQAKSLEGATMPNGQRCEEWLKDKEGRGEDGENSGPP